MGRFLDILPVRDIAQCMDVGRYVWVCCIFGRRVRIPLDGGMIYRTCGNRRGGECRKSVRTRLDLGSIGRSSPRGLYRKRTLGW